MRYMVFRDSLVKPGAATGASGTTYGSGYRHTKEYATLPYRPLTLTKLPAADASTHRQLLGLDLRDPCRGLLLPAPHPHYLDLLDRIGRALAHLVVRPSQAHEDIVLDCHRDFQAFGHWNPSQPGVFRGQMRRAGLGLPLPPTPRPASFGAWIRSSIGIPVASLP